MKAAPPEDLAQAVEDGWLPIREVARQTGVNAVTLRAWERRYGLIVPQRTPKGHRLFSAEHVQRIHTILTWLNRGVPVGQVKTLIDSAQPATDVVENEWHTLRQTLVQAISELAERRVDDAFNQAMALYPPRTLCEQLLLPLLNDLELRWQGAPLLLVNHSDLPLEPHLWLSAWLASSADCPVEVFDWPLPAGELALAVEHLKPRAVLLYSSKALHVPALGKLLGGVDCPTLIAGPTVCIHQAELAVLSTDTPQLCVAEDPLSAHQLLIQRGIV